MNNEIVEMINNFPIGSFPQTREESLSKAEIVAFLARFQDQFTTIEDINERERIVRSFLEKVMELQAGEMLPSLEQAEEILKLSPGFIKDYGKVQIIKETNDNFDKTFDALASNIGLINEDAPKLR